ncbi:hypothetical protein ACFUC2_05015 [[Kitasatospora] papulosa]|uniref:hypothetical protein n=1 Tax=[Kitasatospora] papulosa TaxID=1464011 RepID=UPI003637E91B
MPMITATTAELHPRAELFAIATAARTRALAPDTPEADRPALLELDDEARWTGQHCYPGGKWVRTNFIVALLLEDFRRDAARAGLPPLDTTDLPALLHGSAVSWLRNIHNGRTPQVAEVEFTAGPFGTRIEWRTITNVVTRYTNGAERTNISYPGMPLGYFLGGLAELQPPTTGDKLTLRVAPRP